MKIFALFIAVMFLTGCPDPYSFGNSNKTPEETKCCCDSLENGLNVWTCPSHPYTRGACYPNERRIRCKSKHSHRHDKYDDYHDHDHKHRRNRH